MHVPGARGVRVQARRLPIYLVFPVLLPTLPAARPPDRATRCPATHLLQPLHFFSDLMAFFTSLGAGDVYSSPLDGERLLRAHFICLTCNMM